MTLGLRPVDPATRVYDIFLTIEDDSQTITLIDTTQPIQFGNINRGY